MNVDNAIRLSNRIAELIGLCGGFQARFGTNFTLKPGSDPEAWQLFNTVLNKQGEIAAMLDDQAVNCPHITLGKWWERRDVPDLPTVTRLMDEVTRLIGACAYAENRPDEIEMSYNVKAAQCVIAGLLHPSARQMAQGSDAARQRAVG